MRSIFCTFGCRVPSFSVYSISIHVYVWMHTCMCAPHPHPPPRCQHLVICHASALEWGTWNQQHWCWTLTDIPSGYLENKIEARTGFVKQVFIHANKSNIETVPTTYIVRSETGHSFRSKTCHGISGCSESEHWLSHFFPWVCKAPFGKWPLTCDANVTHLISTLGSL